MWTESVIVGIVGVVAGAISSGGVITLIVRHYLNKNQLLTRIVKQLTNTRDSADLCLETVMILLECNIENKFNGNSHAQLAKIKTYLLNRAHENISMEQGA